MADLFEDDGDLFVAGLAAGNHRVAVGIIAAKAITRSQFRIHPIG